MGGLPGCLGTCIGTSGLTLASFCTRPQTELDAALKQMQEMQEEQEKIQKQAAEALADAVEQHGVELQRLGVERSRLQVRWRQLLAAAGLRACVLP